MNNLKYYTLVSLIVGLYAVEFAKSFGGHNG